MPHRITYSIHVGPEDDKFGMRETSVPSDAILIADNKSSNFQLSRLVQDDSNYVPKTIYQIDNAVNSTKITSNTADIMMSDVVDSSKNYLYYKVFNKLPYAAKVMLNGEDHSVLDVNFVYTNYEQCVVEYYDKSDNLLLRESVSSMPVFIWERHRHLEHVIDIDNRKFTYGIRKGKILISASKSNVFAKVKNESVFHLHKDKELTFSIKPFIHRSIRNINGERVIFDYDYSRALPNISTVHSEVSRLKDRYLIDLKNNMVLKGSIEVSVLDRKTRVEQFRITEINNGNVDTINGIVNIKNFISANDINVDNYIFVSSYKFLELEDLTVSVDTKGHDTKNRLVYFNIKPTSVRHGNVELDFNPEISYTLTENNGDIVMSSDTDVPLYTYQIPIYLGYGEGGYSEDGYSGITDTIADLTAEQVAEYGWGWGELGYGQGPFGGSFIKNFADVRRLLEVKNNSTVGSITIARLDLNPTIDNSNIFIDLSMSRATNGRFDTEDLFSGGVWHISKDGNYSDITLSSGIYEYRSLAGVVFNGTIVDNSADVVLEFDISDIASGINTSSQEVDNSIVLTSGIDSDAYNTYQLYSQLVNDSSLSLDSLTLFSKDSEGRIEEVPSQMVISSDFNSIVCKFAKNSYSNIGLGIKNGNDLIYPSEFIKI